MKEWVKWAVPIGISIMFTIVAWISGYAVLKSQVDDMRSELAEAKVLVMKSELGHMEKQNEEINTKMNMIIQKLLEAN